MRHKIAKFITSAVLAGVALYSFAETEVELGDDEKTVLSILGKPRGKMKRGNSESWSYLRGVIKFTDGEVTYVNIDSPEKARAKERERKTAIKAQAEAARKAAEERREKIREGQELKASKLKNEEFLALPPEQQLEFWTGFQRNYSMIDISSIVAPLKKTIEQEDAPEEKSEREILIETIDAKQKELDEWIQKAKTISAGRTWRRKYHLARQGLEEDLEKLRAELKAMPSEE